MTMFINLITDLILTDKWLNTVNLQFYLFKSNPHHILFPVAFSQKKKTKKQKGDNPIGSTSDTSDSFKSFVVNIIPSEYPNAVYVMCGSEPAS
jgi:hypothetical protein